MDHNLKPRYYENPPLVFYKRFIDDIFGIWVGTDEQFENLMKDANNNDILKLNFDKPSNTSTFLDLAITFKKVRLPQRPTKRKETPTSTSHNSHPIHLV